MIGGGPSRTLVAAITAALTLVLVPAAAAAPGDVYVVDRSADAVWKLPPTGGDAVALAEGVPPFTGNPDGITFGPDGFLYVADEEGKLFKVNRNTGDVDELADVNGVNPSSNPIDVAFDARGRLFLVDYDADDVYLVNRATGALSLFYDGPNDGFNSIAIRRNGTIFIGDEHQNAIYRLQGGTLTPILEGDPDFTGVDGVLLSPDERFLYFGTWDNPRFGRYDLRTGELTKFELDGAFPWSLALVPNNNLLLTDSNSGHLFTVPRTGGTVQPFSTDPDLQGPREITLEPRRCRGRFPTIVGTNAGEIINGSRFADVILSLGGNDVIRGFAGNDVVCAGKGRDRVIGGRGADRLSGEGGGDRLFGGRGRDRLFGGKGRDRLFGGKGRDRLVGGPGRDQLRGGPGKDRQRQ